MKKKFEEDNENEVFQLDEDIKKIELNKIEIECLNKVYDQLISLEHEESSDDDLAIKKYLKEIENKANQKKMETEAYKTTTKKQNKKELNVILSEANSQLSLSRHQAEKPDNLISVKAIRKILRKIDKVPSREELNLMVWEVDDDLDGRISRYEIEKMYKRCLWDEEELEPKRLYNLVLFLMYDKENRHYITEEDTLELLIIRYGDKFNEALMEIFGETKKDERGKDIKVMRERINYSDFMEILNKCSQKKRKIIKDKIKNYCKYIEKK